MAERAFAELDRAIAEAAPDERPALALALAARLGALAAGMATAAPNRTSSHQPKDENLSVEEAARRLGLSKDWIYRNAVKLPFAVRIGRRLLFSADGLERWNRQRMGRTQPS
jgi:excisionase family DNA binding protein